MRYIFESDSGDFVQKTVDQNKGVTFIDSYEPIERLTARVEKMKQAFEEFKKNRGSWTMLNYYLRGRGISQSEISSVMKGIEEFMSLV